MNDSRYRMMCEVMGLVGFLTGWVALAFDLAILIRGLVEMIA